MLKRMVHALDELWFGAVSPIRLATMRLLVGGYTFWFLWTRKRHILRSAGGEASTFHPIGVARILEAPIDPEYFSLLYSFTLILSFLFCVGFIHRLLAPLFSLCLLFVLTYSNSWSMVFHTENMLIVHVLILAFTPSASAVSVDAGLTHSFPWTRKIGLSLYQTQRASRFAWPIKALQLGATLPYVVAGLAKVRGSSGWEWALGTNLRDQITMNGLYYEVLRGGAKEITFHVYGWDFAFMVAASLTLVLELGAPIALLHRRLGYLVVLGLISMHWSILVLMGIPFPYQLYGFAFACFIEWDRVFDFTQKRWTSFMDQQKSALN